MSDTASIRSRASAMLNRPQIVPMGPRTRQSRTSIRASHIPENVMTPQSTSLDLPEFGGQSSTSSPASMSPSSSRHKSLPQLSEILEEPTSPDVAPAYDHREGESTAEVTPTPSSQVLEPMQLETQHPDYSDSDSLAPASPDAQVPLSSDPPTPVQSDAPTSVQSDLSTSMQSNVSTPSQSDAPILISSDAPIPVPTDSPAPVKVIPIVSNAPKFTPPPPIKFEIAPIEYRALPYEAALCK